jgi:hypothetical protein
MWVAIFCRLVGRHILPPGMEAVCSFDINLMEQVFLEKLISHI